MAKRRKRNRADRKELLARHQGKPFRINQRHGDFTALDRALKDIANERK